MAQEAKKKSAADREWFPAVYARLSDEDGRAGVSLSIENQISVLTKFVKQNGWNKPLVFFDDDKTGTDFDRKGFQDMYAEAKAGNVNVIVIKDTSRFGRNWVQSGMYFEAIEEMGIRFISIQEGVDTVDPKCPALKMLPFYFVFAEWHSSTTSEKVKTVLDNNARDGKYLGARAPYGYQKDPNDRHHLIVDHVAAGAIKRMYELRLQKLSYNAIAHTLNAEGFMSPSAYKLSIGDTVSVPSRHRQWSADCLRDIFVNPVYRGDTVYGRKTVVSYKNHKQVRRPESEWITSVGTHEPLVSREDWQTCFDMIQTLGRVRQTGEGKTLPFTGVLVCEDCGSTLHRTRTFYEVKGGEKRFSDGYNCRVSSSVGKTACCSHYIGVKDLNALVSEDIREKAGNVMKDEETARKRFFAVKSKSDGTQLNADKALLRKTEKRIEELVTLIKAAVEKTVFAGMKDDLCAELVNGYESERRELTEQAAQLSAAIKKNSRTENDVETFIALMKKHADVRELDRETVTTLIDRITVSASGTEPREITIYYKYVGNLS